jgi:transposase InsO family protein
MPVFGKQSRPRRKKKQLKTSSRTAEEPGQTINVDLCFVPASHEVADKIPAVSGSSGRLKVQNSEAETDQRVWPGQVFENPELSYEEAMLEYVAAWREAVHALREKGSATPKKCDEVEQTDQGLPKAQKRVLKRQEIQLRAERRQVREKRKLEDAAWREARAARKVKQQNDRARSKEERRQQRQARKARDEAWRSLREQRRNTLERRKLEDQSWREKRNRLRERISQLPVFTAWIAILVIIDNCTRQCLSLPLFVAGANVTSEMVVEALRTLLPPELRFLISDRGTHFKANAFKMLMLSEEFIHVLIARHRPESNGIAERFIRTLKEWLKDKSWQNGQDLALLLHQFLDEYNDRPHQGLAMPGLSPNEFANRIWLM